MHLRHKRVARLSYWIHKLKALFRKKESEEKHQGLWDKKKEGMSSKAVNVCQHISFNNIGQEKHKLPPVRVEEGMTQFIWKPGQHNEFDIASD